MTPRPNLVDRLGARLRQRGEPRLSITLAAVGAVLVLGGALVWALGYLISGLDLDFGSDDASLTADGQDRRFLGFVLFLACVVIGYVLVIARRTGALATAGAVAGAFGVPLAVLFLSFDLTDVSRGDLPFSLDATYLVSIVVWLISYFAVPGARGRPFYLGIAAAALSAYIGVKAAGADSLVRTTVDTVGTRSVSGTDTDTIAAVGLVLGLAYYAIAALLDRRGYHGAAIGMVYAAFVTTVGGVITAAPSFEQVGTGILLIALGAVLGWYGARFGRRFTTWAWLTGRLIGVVLVVAKAFEDSYTGAGITLIVVGVLVAIAAHALASATREAPDVPTAA
jgi:hypothetical protein